MTKQVPPQIAPPTAPTATDDDTGMVRIWASFPAPTRNRRCPSRVRHKMIREHVGTDKARPTTEHNGDEVMRSMRVTSEETDRASSVAGVVARGLLSTADSMSNDDLSFWCVIICRR